MNIDNIVVKIITDEAKEELNCALNNGIINIQDIKAQIKMNERIKYLDAHNHKIWENQTLGKWCTYLSDKDKPEGRRLIRRKTKKEIEDCIVAYWKEQECNPTIEEVFTEWNDRRLQRKQIKPSTHLVNKQTFKRFYSDLKNRKIKSISETEWEDFLCDCIANFQLTAKAFSNLKGITKGFLKRAKKRGFISMNVEQFFTELDVSDSDFKIKVVDEEDEVFFDDEVDKIMDYIRDNPDCRNLGIALMFVTGIRVGELVALKHEDIEETTFKIKRTETKRRKDGGGYIYYVDEFPKTPAGYRTVIVPSNQKWILNKIKNLNVYNEYIFCNESGERLNTFSIRKRLYRVCKKVGIKPRSPHKIRKTYGSILLDNGLDAKIIEGQMGHTNISCTEAFYHKNRRRMEEKQKVFDSIPQFAS